MKSHVACSLTAGAVLLVGLLAAPSATAIRKASNAGARLGEGAGEGETSKAQQSGPDGRTPSSQGAHGGASSAAITLVPGEGFGPFDRLADRIGSTTINAAVLKLGPTRILSGIGLGGNAAVEMSGDGDPGDIRAVRDGNAADGDRWYGMGIIEFHLGLGAEERTPDESGIVALNGDFEANAFAGELAPIGAPLAGQDAPRINVADADSLGSVAIVGSGTLSLNDTVFSIGDILPGAATPPVRGGAGGFLPTIPPGSMPPLLAPPAPAVLAPGRAPNLKRDSEWSAPLTAGGATTWTGSAIPNGTTAAGLSGPANLESTGPVSASASFDSTATGSLTLTGASDYTSANVDDAATLNSTAALPEGASLAGTAILVKGANFSANAGAVLTSSTALAGNALLISNGGTEMTSNALLAPNIAAAPSAPVVTTALVANQTETVNTTPASGAPAGATPLTSGQSATTTVLLASLGSSNSIVAVPAKGTVTTVSSGGSLGNPEGLAFSLSGNLYVANNNSNTVEQFSLSINASGNVVGADQGVFASTGLSSPTGMAVDSHGNLYVANEGTVSNPSYTIEKFSPTGSASLFVASNAGLNMPNGMAFDSAGNLYVANQGSNKIDIIPTTGANAGVVSTFITPAAGLTQPVGLAFDASGNLYVTFLTALDYVIEKYSSTGADLGMFASESVLAVPVGLAFDSAGDLYVAESALKKIEEYSPTGADLGAFATNVTDPEYLAFATIPIPEPGAIWLLLSAVAGFAPRRRPRCRRGDIREPDTPLI